MAGHRARRPTGTRGRPARPGPGADQTL